MFSRIYIEITEHCNLNCSFCPIDPSASRFMSPESFKVVLEKISPWTKVVALHILGEPLAHPEIAAIFDLCAEKNLKVFLVTNGLLLKTHKHLLLHPALLQLHVSLQSFADNFPNKDPKPYLIGLREVILTALKTNLSLQTSLRLWDMVKGTESSAFGTALPPSFRAHLAEIFAFDWESVSIDLKCKKRHYLQDRLDLYFDSRFTWPTTTGLSQFSKGTCHALKHHLGIRVDGTVVPCCLDSKGAIALGNIYTTSLQEVLLRPRTKAMLQGFKMGQMIEPLCQRCDFAQRFSVKGLPAETSPLDT